MNYIKKYKTYTRTLEEDLNKWRIYLMWIET